MPDQIMADQTVLSIEDGMIAVQLSQPKQPPMPDKQMLTLKEATKNAADKLRLLTYLRQQSVLLNSKIAAVQIEADKALAIRQHGLDNGLKDEIA